MLCGKIKHVSKGTGIWRFLPVEKRKPNQTTAEEEERIPQNVKMTLLAFVLKSYRPPVF